MIIFFALVCVISIHALREEGDGRCRAYYSRLRHFYPRPPRGGRRAAVLHAAIHHKFLSTPSARRATLYTNVGTDMMSISIHALREEGDSWHPARKTLTS